jgi:thiol-disulfide isomerase/thioredoxin
MRILPLIALLLTGVLRLPAQPVGQPIDPPALPEEAAFDALYSHRQAPVVEGRIINLTPAECSQLPVTYTIVTPFGSFQSKRTAILTEDGNFTLPLDYALPYQQIWLQVGDLFFGGIYANKDLRIELDGQKLKATGGVSFFGEGVRFEGTDGSLNTYLGEWLIRRSEEQKRLESRRQMLIMQAGKNTDGVVPEFMRLTDSLEAIESAYIAAHPSPYSAILQNENRSECYAQLCSAYWWKTMPDSLWTKVNRHKAWCISNSGSQFYSYLANYIQLSQGQQRSKVPLAMQRIDSLFPAAKADFLKLHLGLPQDIIGEKTGFETIGAGLHTPWCAAVVAAESRRIEKNIAEINKALAESRIPGDSTALGRPLLATSFGATLYKADHLSASDLLGRMAKACPGKAIILDRWATWCGACLNEMPHSRQLEQDAAGLPVVFIYLCTTKGSSEETWKTSVFRLRQPGIHILIDEKLDSEISEYFSFGGYPGYALIGRDGRYKSGAIHWMSEIADRKALEMLIAR